MRKSFYKISVLFLILSFKVFSQFEVGFYIPLGFGGTDVDTSIGYGEVPPYNRPIIINGHYNVEINALLQAGYNFNFGESKIFEGLGLFFETGYSLFSYSTKQDFTFEMGPTRMRLSYTEDIVFHSLNFGILPKVNFKGTSLGIGGGVRVPLGGFSEITDQYSNTDNLPSEETIKHNYSDLKDTFKYLVTPYIKVTSEYKIPVKDSRYSPVIGFYYIADFGMKYKTDDINKDLEIFSGKPYFKKYEISSYTIGVLLGVSFK